MLVQNPVVFDGRVLRHAEALARAGHRVTVLGVIGPNDTDRPLPKGLPFTVRRLRRQKRGLVPSVFWAETALRQRAAVWLGGLVPAGWLKRLPGLAVLSDLAVAPCGVELAAFALSQSGDVFHANDLNTLPAAAWAAAMTGKPYVYDAHEFYVEESPLLTPQQRLARRTTESRLAHKAAAVLTVNKLLATELERLHGIPRPVVVRNLPPLFHTRDPAERPPGPAGTLRLLYHGTHVGLSQPGVDDVLVAMAQLRRAQQASIVLTLRGQVSADERRKLQQRIQALDLTQQVCLSPPVCGPLELMQQAVADGAEVGLALHPPLLGNYRLATSSKVYEYQMAGLAVCATDTPGSRLILDERAGVFFPFGDTQQLTDTLQGLAHNRAHLKALRQGARQRALAEFAWEHEQARLLSIYERLSPLRHWADLPDD